MNNNPDLPPGFESDPSPTLNWEAVEDEIKIIYPDIDIRELGIGRAIYRTLMRGDTTALYDTGFWGALWAYSTQQILTIEGYPPLPVDFFSDTHVGYYVTGAETVPEAQVSLSIKLLEMANFQYGDIILDVACGRGGLSRLFSYLTEGGKVYAFNTSTYQLNEAMLLTENMIGQGYKLKSGIEFFEHDAHKPLDIEANGAIVLEALLHMNPEIVLANLNRNLPIGGKLLTTNPELLNVSAMDRIMLQKGFASTFISKEKMDEIYEKTGFKLVRREDCTNAMAPLMPKIGDRIRSGEARQALEQVLGRAGAYLAEKFWYRIEEIYKGIGYYADYAVKVREIDEA